MNRPERKMCCRLIHITLTVVWLAAVPWSAEGGRDAALLKPYTQTFPSASRVEVVKFDSRQPRATKTVELYNGEELLGYGVELKVTSRSGKFRIQVAVSPQCTVLDVQVPDYPHRRGRAVRKSDFLAQFRGFSYGEPLKLGEQVDGVSGATSSATAVTGGVRQALIMVHRYVSSK